MLSSLLTISSSSWMFIWVMMEINTLMMCSIMSKEFKKENKSNISSMIYLIIQLSSSTILLISLFTMKNLLITQILNIMCISMKMGSWPFHLWYLKTLSYMELKEKSMKLVMTWQKLIPIFLIPFFNLKMIIMLMSIMCMIIPLVKLKKIKSFKPLMILSSVNNNGWLLISCISSSLNMLMFFIFYSMNILLSLNFFKNMKKISSLQNNKLWENLMILANISSIPPSPMFIAKIMIMSCLINNNSPKELILIMMISSCYLIFNYMKKTNFMMLFNPKKNIMKKQKNTNLFTPIISIFSLLYLTKIMLG